MGEIVAERLRVIQDALRGRDYARAAQLAHAELASGVEHPLVYNLAALDLERQGRMPEALNLLQSAVRLTPDDAPSRNALGLCLSRLELPEEALAQFDALIALTPSAAFAHASRGNALLALGDLSRAESAFHRALELDAGQGVALARLAQIASRRGQHAQARDWAEKALMVLPGFPDAVMTLAAADLGERQVPRAEARVRELLSDPRLAPVERAHAHGLLGDILDAGHRPAEAFAAYAACNQELRREYASRFGTPPGALDYVRSMIRYFERAHPQAWLPRPSVQSHGGNARGHVFVLGFPRSGTTLLEVILEGHPDVVSLEEKESLMDSVHVFMRRPEDLDRLATAPPEVLDALRESYWKRVAAGGVAVTDKVFVDKYPLNSLKLPLIARLFPDAKIIFACRDPRDIVLSCFRHRFKMSAPIYELLSIEGAARYYDAVMALVVRATSALSLDPCMVRHEDLVTEFAREMKRICAFLRLDWDPAMGDFALRAQFRSVLTPSTAQLVRGLNTEGLGHWHRYREQLQPVLPILDHWIKRFYYDS